MTRGYNACTEPISGNGASVEHIEGMQHDEHCLQNEAHKPHHGMIGICRSRKTLTCPQLHFDHHNPGSMFLHYPSLRIFARQNIPTKWLVQSLQGDRRFCQSTYACYSPSQQYKLRSLNKENNLLVIQASTQSIHYIHATVCANDIQNIAQEPKCTQ